MIDNAFINNASAWTPTKYIERHDGTWEVTRNRQHLHASSRLVASLQLGTMEPLVRRYLAGCAVLDLGAGNSPWAGILRSANSTTLAMDWPSSLHSENPLNVVLDLNHDLPLAGSSVQGILATDVLEHLRDPMHFLREVHRILKPGAVVAGSVPFLYPVHEAPNDFQRLTPYGLRASAEDSGLKCVAITPYGGYVDVMLDFLMKGLPQSFSLATWSCLSAAKDSMIFRKLRSATNDQFSCGICFVMEKPEP